MSSVIISGDVSGTVTLQAPSAAGSTTINLPAVSGGSFIVSDASGNVGIGTSSPSTKLQVAAPNGGVLISGGASTATNLYLAGNGNAAGSTSFDIIQGADNNGYVYNRANGGLIFGTNNSAKVTLDTTGYLLVAAPAGLGYGTGSGGTVTQATNKSTAVTLNKPTGQITMNNAALAANTVVNFNLNNSLVTGTDLIIVNDVGGMAAYGTYIVTARAQGAGVVTISLRNMTGGSLSEAVVINFAVIKGTTS